MNNNGTFDNESLMPNTIFDKFRVFWEFTRPHTIIGSSIGLTTIAIIAYLESQPLGQFNSFYQYAWCYFYSFAIIIATNIAIVGYNEIVDIETDKINKPYLPLAANKMKKTSAVFFVISLNIFPIIASYFTTKYLFFAVLLSLFLGNGYSLPLIRYSKLFLFYELFTITFVRGVVFNIFLFLHFYNSFTNSTALPVHLYSITVFITILCFVIALFKDLPDTEGDIKSNITTPALKFGVKNILNISTFLLFFNFTWIIIYALFYAEPQLRGITIFSLGHILSFLYLIYHFRKIEPNNELSLRKFYSKIWNIYYLEYPIYLLSILKIHS